MSRLIYINDITAVDADFEPVISRRGPRTGQTVYVSPDPRLINAARGGYSLALDAPPRNGKPATIWSPVGSDEASPSRTYRRYADIKNGDVRYYVDVDRVMAFSSPNFDPSIVFATQYVDPMGVVTPEFARVAERPPGPLSPGPPSRAAKSGLSYVDDTSWHRREIMALQRDRFYKNDYSVNAMAFGSRSMW